MKEVFNLAEVEKVEFKYMNIGMGMQHNYVCAVCKENSAVQDCSTGILQPCRQCEKNYRVKKLNWLDRLIEKYDL